jgi:hypothetical protein
MSEKKDTHMTQSTVDTTPEAPTAPVVPETPSQTSQQEMAPVKTYTQEQVDAILSKAREDEKTKAYNSINKLKEDRATMVSKIKDLETTKDSLQNDLDGVREGKMSELGSVNAELADLRSKHSELETTLEETVLQAATRVDEIKLDTYREKQIAKAGLQFPELVVGTTQEEIDQAIAATKEKESKMEQRIQQKLQKQVVNDLPTPLTIDGAKGRSVVSGDNSPIARQKMAKLSPDEYKLARAQKLADAKAKLGIT